MNPTAVQRRRALKRKPPFKVTITFRNDNPDTIWNTLARKLGREPTDAEAAAEVKRILSEAR